MDYMPSAASLAAAHKGKLKNLRLKTLHNHHGDTRACILNFEKDTKHHDNSMKQSIGSEGKLLAVVTCTLPSYHYIGGHMEIYQELGHPYIQDYSLGHNFTWVLCMNPLMAKVMATTDFIEVDATFRASIELDNLINVITFDYFTLQCKFSY